MKIKRNLNEIFAQIFISRILIFLHDKYFAKCLFIRKSARRVYFCCPIPGGDLRFGSILCLPFYSKVPILYEIAEAPWSAAEWAEALLFVELLQAQPGRHLT